MFESSLIASAQARVSKRTRAIALSSVTFQATLVAGLVAYPLLFPATLPFVSVAPKATSISLRKPEVKIPPKPMIVRTSASPALAAPQAPAPQQQPRSGGIIRNPTPTLTDAPPSITASINMGGGGPLSGSTFGSPDGTLGAPAPTVVRASPKNTEAVRLSGGVTSGMLLAPIKPIYPTIAKMARVEGTVVVTATIDKSGHIIGLQVLSGPEMLRTSAVEAIKDARYRPYLLSGQPTDVITTISVTFHLNA